MCISNEKIHCSRSDTDRAHCSRRRFCVFPFLQRRPLAGYLVGRAGRRVNWTGDNMQNLETVTFTRNDDGTITVDHKVQVGSREIEGSLSGEGKVDGGRLQVTLKNGKTESFSYNAVDKTIATPLTNADDTPVTLKELTGDNNDEMERIRSQIVQISQKPENKIDKTLASSRS